jgi:hypothetical protein
MKDVSIIGQCCAGRIAYRTHHEDTEPGSTGYRIGASLPYQAYQTDRQGEDDGPFQVAFPSSLAVVEWRLRFGF